MDDFLPNNFRDFVIKGDIDFHREEMKQWGAIWSQEFKVWIIQDTNEMSPDYQAIVELGLNLMPIQENIREKMVITQLTTRGIK